MEFLNIYQSLNNFFNSINIEIDNDPLDFENEEIYIKQKYKNNFTVLKLFSYSNENITYKITGDTLTELNNIKNSLIKEINDLNFLEAKIEDTYIIHVYLVCDKNEDIAHLNFRFHKLSAQTPKLNFINQDLKSFNFTVSYKNCCFEYFINNTKLYKTFESMLLNAFKREIMQNHPDLIFEESKEFLKIMKLINY